MSNHVTSLLRHRTLGLDVTCKAIILYMGDLASDDGTGIYASKATMARELETTDRTIRRCTQKLIEAGYVTEVGARKHQNGFTIEYKIEVETVESLPDNRPSRRTVCQGSTQDVDTEPQNIAADTPSPLTESPVTPDTPSPQDRTESPPNQIKPKKNQEALHGEAAPRRATSPPAKSGRSPFFSEVEIRSAAQRINTKKAFLCSQISEAIAHAAWTQGETTLEACHTVGLLKEIPKASEPETETA